MGKKKNLVILGVIAVLIAVLAAAALLMPKSASVSGESEILITVDGKEWRRVVEQEDGSRNEIVVTSEGAYMAFSSCDNQLCVHMGEVTLDNWETRPNQAFIICLPNRVSVELIPAQ